MAKRLFSPLKRKEAWSNEEFSVKLLEKELEVEKTFSKDSIEDLITLYSEAIEHYNEISDPKFYDYQDRMHSLLMRPEVSSVTNGKNMQNFYNYTKRKNFCSQQLIKSKVLENQPLRKLNKIKTEEIPINTKKTEILRNVHTQEDNLIKRLNERKERRNIFSEGEELSTKGSYYVDEKEQAEMIMEKFYSGKAKEVTDITVFYLMKMENVDERSKALLAEEMKKEITLVSEKFDRMRINEMKKLKKRCN